MGIGTILQDNQEVSSDFKSTSDGIPKLKSLSFISIKSMSQSLSRVSHYFTISSAMAFICSIWGVSAPFVNYLFSTIYIIKLFGLSNFTLKPSSFFSKSFLYHFLLINLIYLSLLASLLTLAIVTGKSIYQNLMRFQLKDLINYLEKEMEWGGWLGLLASLICMTTYMLWSFFSASSLFHSTFIDCIFMVGTGLSMSFFIMPCIVDFLNQLCKKKDEKTTDSRFKISWIWLFLASIGEALISPIIIYSCKQDLKKNFHIGEKIALHISLVMVISSAILMVITTQALESKKREKKNLSQNQGLCRHKVFGIFLLACTGITGGTFSTYEGLIKLHWFDHAKHGLMIKILWSCTSALYWIAFYRSVYTAMCSKSCQDENTDSSNQETLEKENSYSNISEITKNN